MPAKSKSQRRLMGAALRCKRGGPCPPYARKVAEGMSEDDLHDFASTKDKGLPNRKKPKEMQKAYTRTYRCENCGAAVPVTSFRCPKCGHQDKPERERLALSRDLAVRRGEMGKGVAKMRPCENCGRLMPITSQQCPKCGHVNALHWSQGGSFTRKALYFQSVSGNPVTTGHSEIGTYRIHKNPAGKHVLHFTPKGGGSGDVLSHHDKFTDAYTAAQKHYYENTTGASRAKAPKPIGTAYDVGFKALASATSAQKEEALKSLVRVNIAVGLALQKSMFATRHSPTQLFRFPLAASQVSHAFSGYHESKHGVHLRLGADVAPQYTGAIRRVSEVSKQGGRHSLYSVADHTGQVHTVYAHHSEMGAAANAAGVKIRRLSGA